MNKPNRPKVSKEVLKTAGRLLKYVTKDYKISFVVVFVCILFSSAASVCVSLSLKFLLDDFIVPLIGQQAPNFGELYKALTVLGIIFLLGVIATFIYTRLMVKMCIRDSQYCGRCDYSVVRFDPCLFKSECVLYCFRDHWTSQRGCVDGFKKKQVVGC